MTNPRDFAILSELTFLLARGYLRHLSVGELGARNSACPPAVAADSKRQNSLDVAAEPKHELDGQRRLRRPRCKPA